MIKSVTIGEYLIRWLHAHGIRHMFGIPGDHLPGFGNFGCGTGRQIQGGHFNNVRLWHYRRLPELFRAGSGFVVRTESELDAALAESKKWTKCFCLVDVQLDLADRSPAWQRLADRLALRLNRNS